MGRVLSTVLWAFIESLDTRYVGHSRKSCETWAGTSDKLMVIPKDLLVACCETHLRESHKISFNQASNVNGTRPETHARAEFSTSLPALPSHGTQVTSTLDCIVPRIQYFSIMSDVIRRETQIQLQEERIS